MFPSFQQLHYDGIYFVYPAYEMHESFVCYEINDPEAYDEKPRQKFAARSNPANDRILLEKRHPDSDVSEGAAWPSWNNTLQTYNYMILYTLPMDKNYYFNRFYTNLKKESMILSNNNFYESKTVYVYLAWKGGGFATGT